MNFAFDFMTVYRAIAGALAGQSFTANGQAVTVPAVFFNEKPEQRNARTGPSYPSLTLRTFTPIQSEVVSNEPLCVKLEVAAAPPYLDGVKTATLALAEGETLEVTKWNESVPEILTVLLSAGDFAAIGAATPLELADVLADQLPGVTVTLQAGNAVRLRHDAASSGSMLQITGGTAAALVASFPSYRVIGRDAGTELRRLKAPLFYNFLFHLIHKSARADHHSLVSRLVERLFILSDPDSYNERALAVAGNMHDLIRGTPVDDPYADEGVFVVTAPFTLRNVPIVLDDGFPAADNFNGGNYGGTGRQPFSQAPLDITLVLEIGPVDHREPL